jgi:23S rRNA maturation mini-RNase III
MKKEMKNSVVGNERSSSVLQKIKLEKQRLAAQNGVLIRLIEKVTDKNVTIVKKDKNLKPKKKKK